MGDSYNNSGNNFGHMGPVNIGRQRFEFTPAVGRELLSVVPKDTVIDVDIIGSNHAATVGEQVVQFLRENGYSFGNMRRIGMMAPPPSAPLSFDGKRLTIAADL